MLIESVMPTPDAIIAEHAIVAADTATTFRAARTLDLMTVRSPLFALSMWIRRLPSSCSANPLPRFPDW